MCVIVSEIVFSAHVINYVKLLLCTHAAFYLLINIYIVYCIDALAHIVHTQTRRVSVSFNFYIYHHIIVADSLILFFALFSIMNLSFL